MHLTGDGEAHLARALAGGSRLEFGNALFQICAAGSAKVGRSCGADTHDQPECGGDIVVRVGNVSVPATAIQASPDIPRNIAIVMDTGPDQANVLSKEKEMAVALINALSNATRL